VAKNQQFWSKTKVVSYRSFRENDIIIIARSVPWIHSGIGLDRRFGSLLDPCIPGSNFSESVLNGRFPVLDWEPPARIIHTPANPIFQKCTETKSTWEGNEPRALVKWRKKNRGREAEWGVKQNANFKESIRGVQGTRDEVFRDRAPV